MSKVFMVDMRSSPKRGMMTKLEELMESVNISGMIDSGDLVVVKTHFGERGSTAFVPVVYIRRLVERVKKLGGKPFLTDSGILYVGGRSNAYDHLCTASFHGFSQETAGAPIIIADGLTGHDFVEIEVGGRYFEKVKIASAAVHAQAMIIVTHMTGHELTGFGAALKNVGMGLGSRGGKQQMHSDVRPEVDEAKCTACATCIEYCPAGAISMVGKGKSKHATIDHDKCIGCGECTVMCLEGAIAARWEEGDPGVSQRKIAEYAKGVLKGKEGKYAFFNFLTRISPACDCWNYSDVPAVPDIGILASTDIVAIDQASVDLVNREAGKDLFRSLYPNVDWGIQVEHAEEMGLGSRDYELVKLG
ncbi:MAG: DUF362 domain-containing protein [Actinomycetota bacterium]|nr:DUF362 domain-containing protein [Actinomycetota bacterium]